MCLKSRELVLPAVVGRERVSGCAGAVPQFAELRTKLNLAKRSLPLPKLMIAMGDGTSARRSARCPFHKDANPSFSVFQKKNGGWAFNCFAGCGGGDEIDYIALKRGLSRKSAIAEFLKMAGL